MSKIKTVNPVPWPTQLPNINPRNVVCEDFKPAKTTAQIKELSE